jgi:hypothetical protein
MNTGRREMGSFGTNTGAFAVGGMTLPGLAFTAKVEQYNGTAWTEVQDMTTTRSYSMCAGTSTEAFSASGTLAPSAKSSVTEEWADPTYAALTFTSS